MGRVLFVTGSGVYSLGQGSTIKKTSLMLGFEPNALWTGSITLTKKVADQPTAYLARSVNQQTGVESTGSLAAGSHKADSSFAELFVSTSAVTVVAGATASFYYDTITE